MNRRLFNSLAAASLLFCVATILMWARSYTVQEAAFFRCRVNRVSVNSDCGAVTVLMYDLPLNSWDRVSYARWFQHGSFWQAAISAQPRWYTRLGFDYASFGMVLWLVQLPYWFLLLVFAALLIRIVCRARRRRLHSEACVACGYDLRATPHRCPECGTVVRGMGVPPM